MTREADVARHYARDGLERTILDALAASGKDTGRIVPADLSAVDEFHLGWRPATEALAASLGLTADMHLLDIGSGLGGPARHFADGYGCRVTGIDLTPDYVEVANRLTVRCGLADRVAFRQASALDLPFAGASFDVATLIHVGMNIADKAALFAQVRRVLKPGSRFGIYDVMRIAAGEIAYPTPWAAAADTSFVETPETYETLLEATGFAVETKTDRRGMVLELGRTMREKVARDGESPLGLHLLMGVAERAVRVGNLTAALQQGIAAPIEIIARAC